MTQEQVMKESRRLLFLMTAAFFACAVAVASREGSSNAAMWRDGGLCVILGGVCVATGISQSFWFRLIGMAVCLLAAVFALMTVGGPKGAVVILIFVIARMIYRMIKYGDVLEESDVFRDEDSLTQVPDRFTEEMSPGRLILIAVIILIAGLLVYWSDRLKSDRTYEFQKNQKSQGRK